ncbi:Uncharacterised protein [Sphingobacterium spiritivorum]|uniref:Uncharacterized protein n=1 Tax=Sphingobacterium spiritivorum TaxID=258 RepID=A0A380BBV2_SPHSI|nr:CshA/CshB family fibrillar adhesin-related protein [Sphingobacterium spiritivorum]SUI97826.1 Uncharacterised protein [Sphingobacterium spiritivorum]
MRKILLFILICGFFVQQNASGQCPLPAGKFATAAFATGGSSIYKNNVLWLTWGAQAATDTYGKHNQTLSNGSASYASINMGGGRYLCIQATISNLVGLINSYAPGNYSGDSMDDMYNIGGTGTNNKLVSGIRNTTDGASVSFTLTCKATIDGVPVRLNGMVLGDAESLAAGENFTATASGTWSIVDLKKNTSVTGAYEVRKDNLTGNKQKLSFLRGNDNNTGAVAFLTFNEQAFQGTDLSVSFDVTLKGGGLTAISLGLLPPAIDGGDAPESYGAPLHMIDALNVKYDNIPVNTVVNLNTTSYQVGGLEAPVSGFLGTTGPDADNKPLYSKDAMGDNNDGIAGVNEEDAWPAQYKSFSYKLYYNPNQTITVAIPYKAYRDGYIAGWIDFNQNGVFEASERAVATATASGTSVNLTWTVPANRVIRSTYVRLRYGYNLNELQLPTGSAVGGEVEDHKIFIQGSAITNPMLPNKGKK